jgi:hypothetical protein
MSDVVDCCKCAGLGLVKAFYREEWMLIECDRCDGDGVDPDAKAQMPPPSAKQNTVSGG